MAKNKSAPGDKFIWIGFIAAPVLGTVGPSWIYRGLSEVSNPWVSMLGIPAALTAILVALGVWTNRKDANLAVASVEPERKAKQRKSAFIVLMSGLLCTGIAVVLFPHDENGLGQAMLAFLVFIAGLVTVWISLAKLAVALSHPVFSASLPSADPETPTI